MSICTTGRRRNKPSYLEDYTLNCMNTSLLKVNTPPPRMTYTNHHAIPHAFNISTPKQQDHTTSSCLLLHSFFPPVNTLNTGIHHLNNMIDQTTGKMCAYKKLYTGKVKGQESQTWTKSFCNEIFCIA